MLEARCVRILLLITAVAPVLAGCDAEDRTRHAATAEDGASAQQAEPSRATDLTRNTASNPPVRPLVYSGRTLDEWRRMMKTLEANTQQSLKAVSGLIELIQARDIPWFTRRQAAHTLARIGEPAERAIPVLIDLLDERPDDVDTTFAWSTKALAQFGPLARAAARPMIDILSDSSQPILRRQLAVEVLAGIGIADPAVIPALVDALGNDSSPGNQTSTREVAQLRALIADAIAIIGTPASVAVPGLIRSTRDENESVRRSAVAALGAMGTAAGVAAGALAESMATDVSPAVRDRSSEALARVGAEALPLLRRLVGDNDAEIRWRSIAALGAMGPIAKPATAELVDALNDESEQVQISAAEAIWNVSRDVEIVARAAANSLTSRDRPIRIRGLNLLKAMGRDAQVAIEPLNRLKNHERPEVRSIAAKALEMIARQE